MSAPDLDVVANLNQVDLTLDVTTLLREGTASSHDQASNTDAAGWLTRGELDKDEYVRFLIILWHVYSNLEESLERHAAHPTLAPTYNPTLLFRTQALSSDIAHLLSTPESTWSEHPIAHSISSAPPAPLAQYLERIRVVGSSPDPSALLAHAYVRYLGDLSGGQIIRRHISKAYDLDTASGLGTQFYEFQKLGGGGVAGIGDMRHIKQWYRDGMNKGVGDNQHRKAILLSEARLAYQLNTALLGTLRAPSPSKTPDLPVEEAVHMDMKPGAHSKFTVAGVLSFMLAVGISHFVLVTGGFLGDAGLEKWDWAREWLGTVFGIPAAAA
ncbi:heme oxygenase 1 [Gautieria morchelliformis]|nr:heme oxygenase 1 [Gautieria morchelliformis]